MPDDDFNFDDSDKGGDAELSLDDFFQPAGEGAAKPPEKKAKDSIVDDFFSPTGDEDSALPVEKGKIDEIAPEEAPPSEPTVTFEQDSPPAEPPAEKGKGFFGKNWLLILIGVLVVLVVGGGSFLGYTILQKRKQGEEKAVAKDTKPSDQKPAKPEPKPGPQPAPKPADNKPQPVPVKPPTPAKPEPVKPAPDKPKDVAKAPPEPVKPPVVKEPVKSPIPDKPKDPPKPEPVKDKKPEPRKGVPSTGGDYTVQIGAYMMPASRQEVENRLRQLGYQDLHYVKEYRTLKIYHVLVGANLGRDKAEKIQGELEAMGYHPELWSGPSGYRVLVYSYGNKSTALSAQRKVEKAGFKSVKVEPETKEVGLDQLRVGSYASRKDATQALADLRRGGFKGAYVLKE